MTTDLESTIEYYKDLLLYQYINQPNARAIIGLLVSQSLIDLLPLELDRAFDIETATGPQLDIIGEYIGVSRVINTTLSRDYFTFEDSQNPATSLYGFTDYLDTILNANVTFYEYVDTSKITSSLIDSEYRILLKLKSLCNMSNNSLSKINEILYEFFGTDITVFDQLDMTMSYFVKSNISRIISIANNQNLLPKPAGVFLSVFTSIDVTKLWGLNDYIGSSYYTTGFSNYTSGFVDSIILDYTDRI